MEIKKGKRVKVQYQLRLESFDGELVEETRENEPEVFVVGDDAMLDIFENQLLGKKAGDDFRIEIHAADAFGDYDPDALIEFTEEEFYELVGEEKGDFELGAYFPMEDDEGNNYDGFITEIEEDRVVVDFNHPLAGETLYFAGKVLEVSEPEA
ncbi:MAG: FKBP-type peptidyl-prolyl cis-trans isomerase [Bacteroidales bacterium]|jgi:FKBP-type peptidyl-prolyl cis-trans isomerase SlyD|nr:FKBP-type peptidyl-prolyl cis-trans isomerase [Bacteroidales bacterium]